LLKRVLKSISAIFAGQMVNIVGNLLLVPLFLSHWPVDVYGEWMALSAVVAYFGVTDLGMNSAAANAMTAAYARGDLDRFHYVQGSAMAFYVGAAIGLSLLFGLVTALLPIPVWIGIRHIPLGVAALSTWVLASTVLWQMPAWQLRGIYRSTGNLAATQWLWNLQAIGLLVVTVAVLQVHGGVLALALWGASPLLVVTIWAWMSLRHSHPELLPKLSEVRIVGVKELLGPSFFFGLIMLSMALAVQGPVLMVSRRLGGAAVALLITTRTLANAVRQMVAPVQVALWPELTRLDAVGAEASLRIGHRLLMTTSVALSAAFAATLWFEGAGIIAVWTGSKLKPDIWLLRCFLSAIVLQAPWLASSAFLIASNRHRRLAQSYLGSAIIALCAIAILLRSYGLIAVPLGILIGEGLACYHFVIKDACLAFKEDYVRFAVRLWFGVGTTSIAAWCGGYIGHSFAIGPAPVRWIEVGALTTMAAALTTWCLALRKDDRSRLTGWGKAHWSAFQLAGAQLVD